MRRSPTPSFWVRVSSVCTWNEVACSIFFLFSCQVRIDWIARLRCLGSWILWVGNSFPPLGKRSTSGLPLYGSQVGFFSFFKFDGVFFSPSEICELCILCGEGPGGAEFDAVQTPLVRAEPSHELRLSLFLQPRMFDYLCV